MKQEQIRVAILGTGSMAAQRAAAFAAMDRTRVTHICSRRREKASALAQSVGAAAADHDPAVLDQADAVVVCLPNHRHYEAAHPALQAGKHVLVEYPLCVTPAELESLREAAEAAQVVLLAGNTIIHEAMWHYIQRHRERLGTLLSGASRVAAYDAGMSDMWYMQPEAVGPIFAGLHYHHIEYYRRLLGEVTQVWARDQQRHDPQGPSPCAARGGVLTMHHEGGAASTVHWYLFTGQPPSGPGVPRCLWLNGSRDSLTLVERDPGCTAVWGEGGGEREETFASEWGVTGSCRAFVEAMEGRADHRAQLAGDIRTLQVGWAAAASAADGGLVAVSGRERG